MSSPKEVNKRHCTVKKEEAKKHSSQTRSRVSGDPEETGGGQVAPHMVISGRHSPAAREFWLSSVPRARAFHARRRGGEVCGWYFFVLVFVGIFFFSLYRFTMRKGYKTTKD